MKAQQARTFLFVPGDQLEKIVKAFQSDADAVIIDLEDSVRSENKVLARNSLSRRDNSDVPLLIVRVNELGSPEYLDDLKAAISVGADAIMIPKFVPGARAIAIDEDITQIENELGVLTPITVFGLIESSTAVVALINDSQIPSRVSRLALGMADLLHDLGVQTNTPGIFQDLAMASLVLASAVNTLSPPIASPHFTLRDSEGLRVSASRARSMGFGGQLCIHPEQIPVIKECFAVNADDQSWAQNVISHWNDLENNKKGAIVVDGELVDEAMIKRARAILKLLA